MNTGMPPLRATSLGMYENSPTLLWLVSAKGACPLGPPLSWYDTTVGWLCWVIKADDIIGGGWVGGAMGGATDFDTEWVIFNSAFFLFLSLRDFSFFFRFLLASFTIKCTGRPSDIELSLPPSLLSKSMSKSARGRSRGSMPGGGGSWPREAKRARMALRYSSSNSRRIRST